MKTFKWLTMTVFILFISIDYSIANVDIDDTNGQFNRFKEKTEDILDKNRDRILEQQRSKVAVCNKIVITKNGKIFCITVKPKDVKKVKRFKSDKVV